jgi:pimeloyl-ACP methyl ester carboxylesterase
VPYADANGHRLYYEVHGDGPALLCVGGFGVDVSDWRAQIPAFSRGMRVIVFDNRDAGRSTYADAPYAVADMAADTLGLVEALGLERFHLLGVSLGGAIAQDVACAIGERVLTLTLAVSYARAGAWARERVRQQLRGAAERSDEDLLRDLMVLSVAESTYDAIEDMAAVRRMLLLYPHRQRRDGFVRQLEASVRHDASDRLGALTMPVHVIGAEQDLLVPVWKTRELAALVPGCRLSIVEGAAHRVTVEAAARFNELVLEFVANQAR